MKRDDFTLPLAFPGELIIDNFAGGGGTSTGLEKAFGRPVDIAINHDPEALAMHAANHPHTLHLCESVWAVKPTVVTRNQPVALVWLSPDCKHFSKAKGGTPVSRDIRGLAWVGIRWALETKPRVIMLENVAEFRTWGPVIELPDGKTMPDKARAGQTFKAFCAMLTTGVAADHPALAECCHFLGIEVASEQAQRLVRGLGYKLDVRELRACDHNTPTIRNRLFVVARRDGLPITWPDTTNAEPDDRRVLAGKLAPFRTAADCIDFSDRGRSIFGRKKDLARNTLRRVAKGAWRHVLTSAKPFIVNTRNGEREGQQPRVRGVDQPYWTPTSQGSQGALATAALIPVGHGERRAGDSRTADLTQPMGTLLAGGGKYALAEAHLSAPLLVTNTTGHSGAAADEPVPTIATGGHHALVNAYLIDLGHGEGKCGTRRFSHGVRELTIPLGTCTASNPPSALVSAYLEQANGGFYAGEGRPATSPVSTITTAGSNQQLVTAYLVKYYSSGGQWQGAGEPMHTLPTKGRMGLVQLAQVPVDCLQPEQLERARQCAALLHEHLPEHFPQPADLVLVHVDGCWRVLADIFLRMLRPRELFNAQGFPPEYVIDSVPDPKLLFSNGQQVVHPLDLPRVPLTTTAQVRMVGNSVCPPVAEALARSNFAHEAAWMAAA